MRARTPPLLLAALVLAVLIGVRPAGRTQAAAPLKPTVSGVSPTGGPAAGGTIVTITGTNYSTASGATSVKLGTAAATGVSCGSTTSCTATSPAKAAADSLTVHVTVSVATPDGPSTSVET